MFLDRDGVLNEAVVCGGKPLSPMSVAEVVVPADATKALNSLRQNGFHLIMVTNQPNIARGVQPRETVHAINLYLKEKLNLHAIEICEHDDADNCDCRKPKPGMLLRAAERDRIALPESFIIGDRWRDIEAGQRAGCHTVLIGNGYGEVLAQAPDAAVATLSAATDYILARSRKRDDTMSTLEQFKVKTVEPLRIKTLDQLKVRIFADGADKAGMLEMYCKPYIKGFTTNPTLMRKAGIAGYETFAKDILSIIPDRSISFEVFSDDFFEMERQARHIATWGKMVSVKIPITNTGRETSIPLIRKLSHDGIALNVTAMFTLQQVRDVVEAVKGGAPCYVSVFAGRIADTGRDPVPLMAESVKILKEAPDTQLIWASPRELLNIFQADDIGCHVITVTNDILKKLSLVGKDMDEYSLETVKMFFDDGQAAKYAL
ncbi:MAG: transaldolase [Xanthobacteraceae bacterium]